MFGIGKKITNISITRPEVEELKKITNKAFSKELKELEQFVTETAPKISTSQEEALKGIEQLSKNIKSMIK